MLAKSNKSSNITFMKYLFLLFVSAFLVSCDPSSESVAAEANEINIDGCQYLQYDQGLLDQRVYSLAHKGNCKNPIHHWNGGDHD